MKRKSFWWCLTCRINFLSILLNLSYLNYVFYVTGIFEHQQNLILIFLIPEFWWFINISGQEEMLENWNTCTNRSRMLYTIPPVYILVAVVPSKLRYCTFHHIPRECHIISDSVPHVTFSTECPTSSDIIISVTFPVLNKGTSWHCLIPLSVPLVLPIPDSVILGQKLSLLLPLVTYPWQCDTIVP